MATVAVDPHLAVERFLRDGPTVDEKAAVVEAAIKYFTEKAMQDAANNASGPSPALFMATNFIATPQDRTANTADNTISETAAAATAVKAVFDQINDRFYSDAYTTWAGTGKGEFWPYFGYRTEWTIFGTRWGQGLATSYYLAERNVDVISRFDSIYLAKVENIKTEQNRLDAIAALQQFLDDNPDRSDEMSQTFLGLKRDIQAFMDTFSQWIAALGIKATLVANTYKANIVTTGDAITKLEKQLREAIGAFCPSAACLETFPPVFLGLPYISIWMLQRDEKKRTLKALQDSLLYLQENPPLELLDRLASWKPDLDQMFDRMLKMAEVWSSVRSQAIQFRAHIEGGLDAATNMRFKNEVKLARTVCGPLKDGQQKYMRGLYLYWNPE